VASSILGTDVCYILPLYRNLMRSIAPFHRTAQSHRRESSLRYAILFWDTIYGAVGRLPAAVGKARLYQLEILLYKKGAMNRVGLSFGIMGIPKLPAISTRH
jgi:hypothetical protein